MRVVWWGWPWIIEYPCTLLSRAIFARFGSMIALPMRESLTFRTIVSLLWFWSFHWPWSSCTLGEGIAWKSRLRPKACLQCLVWTQLQSVPSRPTSYLPSSKILLSWCSSKNWSTLSLTYQHPGLLCSTAAKTASLRSLYFVPAPLALLIFPCCPSWKDPSCSSSSHSLYNSSVIFLVWSLRIIHEPVCTYHVWLSLSERFVSNNYSANWRPVAWWSKIVSPGSWPFPSLLFLTLPAFSRRSSAKADLNLLPPRSQE